MSQYRTWCKIHLWYWSVIQHEQPEPVCTVESQANHDVSILQKIIFRVVRSLQVGCFKIVGAEDDMSSVRRYEKVFHQFVGVK